VRLMLVDDHQLFRAALRELLTGDARFEVVAEAGSAREAYVALESTKPDLVIMDMALPGTTGIAATREILRRQIGCRVLVLSAYADASFVAQALGAGAGGYASKRETSAEIMEAVVRVGAGRSYLPPGMDPNVMRSAQAYRRAGGTGPMAILSVREREVFDLIVSGHSNTEMAAELCISVKTVDTHRARINRKLGLHSTADVIRFAAQNGLMPLVERSSTIPTEVIPDQPRSQSRRGVFDGVSEADPLPAVDRRSTSASAA
jgi:DNA-binding NarL/FixJ family response regulator